MTKLTAQAKHKRDEIGDRLLDATSGSKFNITQLFGGKKFYLFSYENGLSLADAEKRAEKTGEYIAGSFPYLVIITKNSERTRAEIWVRKK